LGIVDWGLGLGPITFLEPNLNLIILNSEAFIILKICYFCGKGGYTKNLCTKVFCLKCRGNHDKIEDCKHQLLRKITNEVNKNNFIELLKVQNKFRQELKKKMEKMMKGIKKDK
jgi:hypothetical protein